MQQLKDAAKARLFRISSDDNIVFLQEIAQSRPESVFDHPYLALYRRAHEKYGAKVVLNLFYDNSTSRGFEKDRGDFDLSMMPDCYKTEWAQNADWLKFSFHALREFPEFPYRTADGETVFADAEKVHREVARFAGKSSLANFATVHYGEITKSGLAALMYAGYKGFCGYFDVKNGKPLVAYGKDEEFCRRITREKISRSDDTVFAKIDLCMNLLQTVRENVAKLSEAVCADEFGFIHIMIHEQYFYEDYAAYMKEYGDILLACCELLSEAGYRGGYYSDISEEFR